MIFLQARAIFYLAFFFATNKKPTFAEWVVALQNRLIESYCNEYILYIN